MSLFKRNNSQNLEAKSVLRNFTTFMVGCIIIAPVTMKLIQVKGVLILIFNHLVLKKN